MNGARLAARVWDALTRDFAPDEERDAQGRWTVGGETTEKPSMKGCLYGTHQYKDAMRRVDNLPLLDDPDGPQDDTLRENPFFQGDKPEIILPPSGQDLAKISPTTIPLSKLNSTQPDVTVKTVSDYVMYPRLNGQSIATKYPAVAYDADRKKYFVADGNHRVVAAWARGEKSMQVRIFKY